MIGISNVEVCRGASAPVGGCEIVADIDSRTPQCWSGFPAADPQDQVEHGRPRRTDTSRRAPVTRGGRDFGDRFVCPLIPDYPGRRRQGGRNASKTALMSRTSERRLPLLRLTLGIMLSVQVQP
jgi:hypothetical protein